MHVFCAGKLVLVCTTSCPCRVLAGDLVCCVSIGNAVKQTEFSLCPTRERQTIYGDQLCSFQSLHSTLTCTTPSTHPLIHLQRTRSVTALLVLLPSVFAA